MGFLKNRNVGESPAAKKLKTLGRRYGKRAACLALSAVMAAGSLPVTAYAAVGGGLFGGRDYAASGSDSATSSNPLKVSAATGSNPFRKEAEEGLFCEAVEIEANTLHYHVDDGSLGPLVADGELLKKGEPLVLVYTYHVPESMLSDLQADVHYYLQIPEHLEVEEDIHEKLFLDMGDGEQEQFGELDTADDGRAYVMFLPGEEGNGTRLEELGGFSEEEGVQKPYLWISCRRAADLPEDVPEEEKAENRYLMEFEDGNELVFGYAEKEPVEETASVEKTGKQDETDRKRINWTITYKPWENPGADTGFSMETPFELRDVIDGSKHSFVEESLVIHRGGEELIPEEYEATSSNAYPADEEAYLVLSEHEGEPEGQLLRVGGAVFAPQRTTEEEPAQNLTITYQTEINDELLLPGRGESSVSNEVDLFAYGTGFEPQGLSQSAKVTVKPSQWVKKEGITERVIGDGAITHWTITIDPNGFVFNDGNKLTLHDVLPEASKLLKDTVEVKDADGGVAANGTAPLVENPSDGCSFEVSPILTDGSPITVTYDTKIDEDVYNSGKDLGFNTAWITFEMEGEGYGTAETPEVSWVGNGVGGYGTAPLLKAAVDQSGAAGNGLYYDTKTRTIEWKITINPHKVDLTSGTFVDDLKQIKGQCSDTGLHGEGLELLGTPEDIEILIDGAEVSEDQKTLVVPSYDEEKQLLTLQVNGLGRKTAVVTYKTRICDPCIFANNGATPIINTIFVYDMIIGNNDPIFRKAEATVNVQLQVLDKQAPVYDYAEQTMEWTVVVNQAGLPMENVVLEDLLPAGLTYVPDSLNAYDAQGVETDSNARVSEGESGTEEAEETGGRQLLTITLPKAGGQVTVTFRTKVAPEKFGFNSAGKVGVSNTVSMSGTADGVDFVGVEDTAVKEFENYGLLKESGTPDLDLGVIPYSVLINPFGLALPGNPTVVDTMDKRLQLDWDTVQFSEVRVKGTTNESGGKPEYEIVGETKSLTPADYDPDTNSFTVRLPIEEGSRSSYLLTYTVDILKQEKGSYKNSIRFDGGDVQIGLGDNGDNSASVGGGGGGGGGAAARLAGIEIVKMDSLNHNPIAGVEFTLYQWDESAGDSGKRGLPMAAGVTDENGKLTFKVKANKKYELVETMAKTGYEPGLGYDENAEGIEDVTEDGGLLLQAKGGGKTLTLSLTNTPKLVPETGGLSFIYVNKEGIPLAGEELILEQVDENGNVIGVDETVVIGPDGKAKFHKLRPGKQYIVKNKKGETVLKVQTPENPADPVKGMLPTGEEIDFGDSDVRLQGKTPELAWEIRLETYDTTDSETHPSLPGVKFSLYTDENGKPGTLIAVGEVDENGVLTFKGLLPDQSYWIVEEAVPDGYGRDGDQPNPALQERIAQNNRLRTYYYKTASEEPEGGGGSGEEPKPDPDKPGTDPDKPGTNPEEPKPDPDKPGTNPEEPKPDPDKPGTNPEEPKPDPGYSGSGTPPKGVSRDEFVKAPMEPEAETAAKEIPKAPRDFKTEEPKPSEEPREAEESRKTEKSREAKTGKTPKAQKPEEVSESGEKPKAGKTSPKTGDSTPRAFAVMCLSGILFALAAFLRTRFGREADEK